jgi:sulfatase maturation enzyme AslB (radical SAM superfamily)
MEKKTAVEWLIERMKTYNMTVSVHNTSHQNVMDFYKAIEQAKAMEKEQRLTMPDYDLEDLATNAANNYDSSGNWHVAYELYKEGFQKAIELLTFKSE